MREAKLICPVNDNAGKSLEHVLNGVRCALINSFGGCTESIMYGSWLNEETNKLHCEPVTVFYVACDDSLETRETLEAIADQIGYKARQFCVYVQYPNGDVVFRATAKFWQDNRVHTDDLQTAVNKAISVA